MAETLEPDVTMAELTLEIPIRFVEHFATLDRVLRSAVEAAEAGLFLGPPRQPAIGEMRAWLCDEVTRQIHEHREPLPWRTRTDVRTTIEDAELPLKTHAALTDAADHVLVTDWASVIVAVSASVTRFLGYDHATDFLGRRRIMAVVPRGTTKHHRGPTLNATNGRDKLLGVRLTVALV